MHCINTLSSTLFLVFYTKRVLYTQHTLHDVTTQSKRRFFVASAVPLQIRSATPKQQHTTNVEQRRVHNAMHAMNVIRGVASLVLHAITPRHDSEVHHNRAYVPTYKQDACNGATCNCNVAHSNNAQKRRQRIRAKRRSTTHQERTQCNCTSS
jgi:hypothetical protein